VSRFRRDVYDEVRVKTRGTKRKAVTLFFHPWYHPSMYKTKHGAITFSIGVICGYNDGMRFLKCGADYVQSTAFLCQSSVRKSKYCDDLVG
jgi:hypothetical protein